MSDTDQKQTSEENPFGFMAGAKSRQLTSKEKRKRLFAFLLALIGCSAQVFGVYGIVIAIPLLGTAFATWDLKKK